MSSLEDHGSHMYVFFRSRRAMKMASSLLDSPTMDTIWPRHTTPPWSGLGICANKQLSKS
jgi:hypothetical protein